MKLRLGNIVVTLLVILLLAFGIPRSIAQAQTQQETLVQYIADLRQNSNDTVLREKIIRHVQTMKKAPPISEEARSHFVEGNVLLKAAKAQKGYEMAIDAYRQCLLLAPWWPEANYNYAVVLELANQFDAAANALKLYIVTNPGAEESRKAQDKIYELGAKKKLAAQEREESSPQAVAAREQDKFETWLRKLDGRRYTTGTPPELSIIDIRGKVFVQGWTGDSNYSGTRGYHEFGGPTGRVEIKGRETTVQINEHASFETVWPVSDNFIISEDGERITVHVHFSDGDSRDYIYLWQR